MMSKNKAIQLLEKVPYQLWVLITVALSFGLLSLIVMKSYSYIDSQKLKSDYPVYDQLIIDAPNQASTYSELTGAWYLKKGSAEMLLEFYDDGYFSWEIIDSEAKFTKLFAAGKYAKTEKGGLLFSQMRELGLPYNSREVGVKIYHLALDESSFMYTVTKNKARDRFLSISFSDNASGINPAVVRLLANLSYNKDSVSLRFLGAPSTHNRRR